MLAYRPNLVPKATIRNVSTRDAQALEETVIFEFAQKPFPLFSSRACRSLVAGQKDLRSGNEISCRAY